MAIVASGKISLNDVNQEFGYPRSTPITLKIRDNSGIKQTFINNSWVDLNPCSTFQPDVITPHRITEWYRYDHNELCSTTTTTTTSTTTTTTIAPCVGVTDFSYTINTIVDGNGFTLDGGVQDINISFNSYSPIGYGTPLEYEYILDGSSTGIVSSNIKNFPSVNVGGHTLVIKVYNCSQTYVVTKTIGFTVNAVTTTTTTSTTTTSTTTTTTAPPCTNITDFETIALNITYPQDINFGYVPINGTLPITVDFTITTFVGRVITYSYLDTTGGGIQVSRITNCSDIGLGTYSITATNCSGVGSVTKTGNFTISSPSLPTPSISSCQYFDGVFYATISATGYNSASTLKVYDYDTDEYIGNMIGGTYTVLVFTTTKRYYVVSELCGYTSGHSAPTTVNLTMSNC